MKGKIGGMKEKELEESSPRVTTSLTPGTLHTERERKKEGQIWKNQ